MTDVPHDPRTVANTLLEEAEKQGIALTNIALQKLIYFAHGIYLIRNKKPLVSGYFEAWKYGPVHPVVYRAFSSAGSNPIRFRACKKDVLTGNKCDAGTEDHPDIRHLIREILLSYGRMSPGRLVEISHARNAPWDFIVDKSRTDVAFGLRIPDDVIIERFRNHKVSIGAEPSLGEPREDTPIA